MLCVTWIFVFVCLRWVSTPHWADSEIVRTTLKPTIILYNSASTVASYVLLLDLYNFKVCTSSIEYIGKTSIRNCNICARCCIYELPSAIKCIGFWQETGRLNAEHASKSDFSKHCIYFIYRLNAYISWDIAAKWNLIFPSHMSISNLSLSLRIKEMRASLQGKWIISIAKQHFCDWFAI